MRPLHLVGSVSLAGLLACGGGSHPKIIDVAIPPDSPPDAFMCAFGTGRDITTKNATNGVIDFSTPPALVLNSVAAQDGKAEFSVVLTFAAPDTDKGVLMAWHDAIGVFAATGAGTAGRFSKPPTAGTYPMDADATIGAGVDVVAGIVDNGDGTVSLQHLNQVYLLSNNPTAMFNLTRFTPAAVLNGTSQMDGAYSGATMTGHTLNPADGTDLTPSGNGCTVGIGMSAPLGWVKLGISWKVLVAAPIDPQPQPDMPDFSRMERVPVIPGALTFE